MIKSTNIKRIVGICIQRGFNVSIYAVMAVLFLITNILVLKMQDIESILETSGKFADDISVEEDMSETINMYSQDEMVDNGESLRDMLSYLQSESKNAVEKISDGNLKGYLGPEPEK